MGKTLYDADPKISVLYQDAQNVLGYDVGALCFEGPAEKLNKTEYTQPALLVTSLAAWANDTRWAINSLGRGRA